MSAVKFSWHQDGWARGFHPLSFNGASLLGSALGPAWGVCGSVVGELWGAVAAPDPRASSSSYWGPKTAAWGKADVSYLSEHTGWLQRSPEIQPHPQAVIHLISAKNHLESDPESNQSPFFSCKVARADASGKRWHRSSFRSPAYMLPTQEFALRIFLRHHFCLCI